MVDTTSDADLQGCLNAVLNDCSLRGAINLANLIAGDDTITFDPTVFSTPQIINLTGILPLLSTNLFIDGPGANLLTVRRNSGGNYNIFVVLRDVTAAIDGLTLTNGANNGGGIANQGTVTLTNSTISGNSGGIGGGIFNNGPSATLTIVNSTISGNTATTNVGGGIANLGGTLTVTNSTISGNFAAAGGGISVASGSLLTTITNTTISGNSTSSGTGGNIYVANNSTILTTLRNTIVAGGTCTGSLNDGGGNLAYPTACGSIAAGSNPLLGALQNNGGTTLTHLPGVGSPAIDAGNDAICAAAPVNNVDQRGVARPQDGNGDSVTHCDIGAVEVAAAPATSTPTSTSTPTDLPTNTPTLTSTPTETVTSTATTTATFTNTPVDACPLLSVDAMFLGDQTLTFTIRNDNLLAATITQVDLVWRPNDPSTMYPERLTLSTSAQPFWIKPVADAPVTAGSYSITSSTPDWNTAEAVMLGNGTSNWTVTFVGGPIPLSSQYSIHDFRGTKLRVQVGAQTCVIDPTETLATVTPSSTPSNTVVPSATWTNTPTNTPVPPSATWTNTPTNTPVPPSATWTNTPTNTPVPPSATWTNTPTNTPIPPSATATNTPTQTNTPAPTLTFYRSVNLGGAALTIDGNNWAANTGSTANLTTNGQVMCNQYQPLNPPTDANRTTMIRCSREHWAHNIVMSGVPNGTYQISIYAWLSWNDPNPAIVSVAIEGTTVVPSYVQGPSAGEWDKLGPFTVNITDGTINIATNGGIVDLSGIEVWTVSGAPAASATPTRTNTPTNTPNIPSLTPTRTNTPTNTPNVPSLTPTRTLTPTNTPFVNSPTPTLTRTATNTPSRTPTPTASNLIFYRAVNLGGAAVVIDGNSWAANTGTTPNLTTNGTAMCNQYVPLIPTTDANRSTMIRCSRQHWGHNLVMSGVPNGTYQVSIYVWLDWADPNPEAFSLAIEGTTVVPSYLPGPVGKWDKLGPFTVNITDSTINVTTNGGLPNLSGIEVWRVN
ncbi:MAG: choice-of-anchor Q domain-containing protein [Anaerolineae bacterium]